MPLETFVAAIDRPRWWSPAEIHSAPAEEFDPHLGRFLAKLENAAWHR